MVFRRFMRSFVLVLSSVGMGLATIVSAQAQTAPQLPENLVAGEGRSVTVNVSNGSRATLTVGTANAFGVTTSMSGMAGTSVKSSSSLAPSLGSISTQLGSSTGDGPPSIAADIQNVRTVGGGSTDFDADSGTSGNVTSEDQAQFAEGNTNLTGMSSTFNMDLSPEGTSFSSSVDNPGTDNAAATNVSNASAAANVNSNINVDISNTSFSSAFSQNF